MTIKLEELLDREQIKEVIYQYCKYVDAKDWDAVHTCFTSDATHLHATIGGNNDEFIAMASGVISQTDGTLHSVGNVLIDMDGTEASSEASFVAYHLIKAGREGYLETKDVDEDWIVAGCYHDRWRKTSDGWKICRRQAKHHWIRREDAMPR